nr:hypothetical protein [Ardenticatenia bacterium]
PTMLEEQAAFAGAQLVFAGDKTPEELAQLTQDVAEKGRDQDPEGVENFTIWAK